MEINDKNVPFGADRKILKLLNSLHFKCYSVLGDKKEITNVIISFYNSFSAKFNIQAKLTCDESTLNEMINSIPVKDFKYYSQEKQLHVKINDINRLKIVLSHLETIANIEIDVFESSLTDKIEQYYKNALKTNQTVFNNIVILKAVIRYLEDKSLEIIYQEPLNEEVKVALKNYSLVK